MVTQEGVKGVEEVKGSIEPKPEEKDTFQEAIYKEIKEICVIDGVRLECFQCKKRRPMRLLRVYWRPNNEVYLELLCDCGYIDLYKVAGNFHEEKLKTNKQKRTSLPTKPVSYTG